jgi:CheY-like chemotaxis protein
MINDILDFSQISNGKLRLSYERFSLWETIKNVSKLIKFQAKRKGLAFFSENLIKNSKNSNAIIKSDPSRIQQILLNLLGNALKFTQRGSVKITLEISSEFYLIKVIDSGLGIKQEDQAKLFQLFSKVDDDHSRDLNKSGVGLGLAISQSLVKILNDHREGAEIKVRSEYTKGSTFIFPLLISSKEDQFDEQYSCKFKEYEEEEMMEKFHLLGRVVKKRGRIQKDIARILIVDDDQINLLVATNYLKSLDTYAFETASDGRCAIELVKKQALSGVFYDLVLMDCNMPVMDGFEATKILISMIESGEIPRLSVIACTANASPKDHEVCFQSGMVDCILKPFSKNELNMKIKKHLLSRNEAFFPKLGEK